MHIKDINSIINPLNSLYRDLFNSHTKLRGNERHLPVEADHYKLLEPTGLSVCINMENITSVITVQTFNMWMRHYNAINFSREKY